MAIMTGVGNGDDKDSNGMDDNNNAAITATTNRGPIHHVLFSSPPPPPPQQQQQQKQLAVVGSSVADVVKSLQKEDGQDTSATLIIQKSALPGDNDANS